MELLPLLRKGSQLFLRMQCLILVVKYLKWRLCSNVYNAIIEYSLVQSVMILLILI